VQLIEKILKLYIYFFQVFGLSMNGQRGAKYVFKSDSSAIESISTFEYHEMVLVLRKEAGGAVEATQELKLTGILLTFIN